MAKTAMFTGALMLAATLALGAQEQYQMTGPVVEADDTKIVIEKDGVSREFARDASTKVTGDLKVGSKVKVAYKLVAVSAEVKGADAAAEPDKAPEGASKSKKAPKADKQ